MSFLPEFGLSVYGGWWFSIVFLISNLVLGIRFPSFRSRILVKPESKNAVERITMTGAFLLFQGGNILAVFIPLPRASIRVYMGDSKFCR